MEKRKLTPRTIARIALYAAVYTALVVGFAPISYGPIQFRLSEPLVIFAYLDFWAIPGFTIGTVISNFFSPVGWIDVVMGLFMCLTVLPLTRIMPSPYLVPLPMVIITPLVVSAYLHVFYNLPYWLNVLYIFISEAILGYAIGLPLLLYILKRPSLRKFFET